MRKTFLILLIFIVLIGCSEKSQNRIFFKPELTIGENTEIEGAWFSNLNSFFVDKKGNIYCADGEDKKIKIFDKDGKPLFQFGRKGQGPGEFSYSNGVAVSKQGNIYVLDGGRRNITLFNEKGEFIKSINIGFPMTPRIEMFDAGNLVVAIFKFDIKNIEQSQFELRLFDKELNEIKSSLYSHSLKNFAWVQGTKDGKMFTTPIPFAPDIIWKVIGNKLYVGFNKEFKISVFDDAGNFLKEIIREITYTKVTSKDKQKWLEKRLAGFKNNPRFDLQLVEKGLKQIPIPDTKPAFSNIAEYSGGMIIFENSIVYGTPGIMFDKNDNETGTAIFEFDDLKFFHGKYYRICGGDDEPFTLIRYKMIQ